MTQTCRGLARFDRLEDSLVLGSVGFNTTDGFQASKHFDGEDARKKRAAERRAKFLQQELSQEGPRSCSPPPSPPLPPPGSGPYVPLIGEGDEPTGDRSKPRAQKGGSIQTRVQQLEQRLRTPQALQRPSGEPEDSVTSHLPARGPGRGSSSPSASPRPNFPTSPDRVVVFTQTEDISAGVQGNDRRTSKSSSFFRNLFGRRGKKKADAGQVSASGDVKMAGVPPTPSSGVDMSLMANILQLASKEPELQAPTSDITWKGKLEGNIDVKVYAPLSSKTLRQTCGVSWDVLIESFLDTAHTAVHVGQRRLGTVKKRGIFSREEDQILLAPSGPYVAKTISAQECKYLARVASRYCEHFQDCQNSLLPRFYCIVRIGKGGRIKTTDYWVVTDNLNDLPLPVRLTYDLKGVSSRNTVVACGNEPLVVLKEGNLPLRDNQRRLPQVRIIMDGLELVCAVHWSLDDGQRYHWHVLSIFCLLSLWEMAEEN